MATWEYNPAGDYRRAPFDEQVSIDGVTRDTYWGGAGAPHQYAFEKKESSGGWTPVNPGEHNEAENYFWAGVSSPQYSKSYADQQAGKASALEQARLYDPSSIGQAVSRPDLVGLNSGGLSGAESAFYTPDILSKFGISLSPQQQAANASQIAQSTPAAQAARNDDGGLFGLGDIGSLALLAAGGYGLGALGGLWGAADGASAGLYGLESGGAGVGAADLGLGYGGAVTGTAGAAGSGGMDELLQQYLQAGYTPEQASYFAQSDLANQALYNAGNYSGAMTTTGLLPEVIPPGGSWTDAIKNFISSNPGSTAQTAIRALSGSGGGSLLGTALGGLLGSMNGAKQAGTTTTTQTPWAGQQPYLLDAFERARTSANGTPLQTQANANYSSVLSGPTKNPMLGMDNPYLTKAIDNANTDVTRAMMPAIDQANHASGSFGNSGVADTYGKNLTDAYSRNATGMRMQDYTNQQNLYQQAVGNTLGFTSNANNYTAQPAQNYAQTIQGNYGGSTTTPYFNNPMAGIMGGAMVGNKIGANLGF